MGPGCGGVGTWLKRRGRDRARPAGAGARAPDAAAARAEAPEGGRPRRALGRRGSEERERDAARAGGRQGRAWAPPGVGVARGRHRRWAGLAAGWAGRGTRGQRRARRRGRESAGESRSRAEASAR